MKLILIELWIDKNKAQVNKEEVQIDKDTSVKPLMINGRCMVPLRFVSESFGAQVEWNSKTKVIKITYNP